MSASHTSKRARGADDKPSKLQMEAVVQTLSQPDVAEELARRISPASGPEHASLREAVRKAGLIVMSEKAFRKIDNRWGRCLERGSSGLDANTARKKLHAAYAEVGEMANGGLDRRAFEDEVAVNYGYNTRGMQDEKLRPRNSHYGLHRDTMSRVFYEGSAQAIRNGAKKALEEYGRANSQVEAMPEVFLLRIDWAEGIENDEGSEEDEDAYGDE